MYGPIAPVIVLASPTYHSPLCAHYMSCWWLYGALLACFSPNSHGRCTPARITCTLPHLPHQSPPLLQCDGMLAVFAQCERAMMPMRMVAALDVQPQREETLGGQTPDGSCLAADGVS